MGRRDFLRLVLPITVGGVCFGADGEVNDVEVSFGVIADPQYADKDAVGSRYYRKSLGKLRKAVEELGRHELDFVVTLGDVIDAGFESFATVMPIYKGLKVPHRLVLGNHDFSVADEDKGKVVGAMGLEKSYYSEVRKGWRFVYLDGTKQSLFRYMKGTVEWVKAKAIFDAMVKVGLAQAKEWNGGVGEEQLTWLKVELEAAKAAGERVIVCNHYPILPAGDAHNLWDAEAVVDLLERYDHVVAYLNGHNHAGNYAVRKGTHFVNFKGMVETEKETAYAVVRCFKDRVEIDGYGAEPDRVVR